MNYCRISDKYKIKEEIFYTLEYKLGHKPNRTSNSYSTTSYALLYLRPAYWTHGSLHVYTAILYGSHSSDIKKLLSPHT